MTFFCFCFFERRGSLLRGGGDAHICLLSVERDIVLLKGFLVCFFFVFVFCFFG